MLGNETRKGRGARVSALIHIKDKRPVPSAERLRACTAPSDEARRRRSSYGPPNPGRLGQRTLLLVEAQAAGILTCHQCVRLCQSICHCVAHPSSRSTQTNRPTKAISPPCWAATEANVEEVIVLSSTSLMLNFANAATLGNTIVIPRLPAA
jgi:hypothetical protein